MDKKDKPTFNEWLASLIEKPQPAEQPQPTIPPSTASNEKIKPYPFPDVGPLRPNPSHDMSRASEGFRIGDYTGLAKILSECNSVDLFHFMLVHGETLGKMLTGESNKSGCVFELKKDDAEYTHFSHTPLGKRQEYITRALKYGKLLEDAGYGNRGGTKRAIHEVRNEEVGRTKLIEYWGIYQEYKEARVNWVMVEF